MTPEQIAAMQLNNAGAPFDGPLSSAKAMHDAKATIIAQAAEIARILATLNLRYTIIEGNFTPDTKGTTL